MTSNNRSKNSLVVVTGASGYLASFIIQELLRRNYNVRGTVRSLKNASTKYRYLYEMDISEERNALELVEADLTSDDNWMEIIADADYVLHTANPMPSRDEKGKALAMTDEKFSGVALQGMKRILNACLQNKKLKKFVYTSSGSAMRKISPEKKKKIRISSPNSWTDVNDASITPYSKSKTLAEKAVWDFAAEHKQNCFPVVSINPSFIIGPLLNYRKYGSFDLIKMPMNGKFPIIAPMMISTIDVRDCAVIHVNALETDNANGKRYVAMNQAIWMKDMCLILYEKYGKDGYDIPSILAPDWVLHLLGMFDPIIHDLICPNMSIFRCIDNSQTMRDLNVVWTPINETIYDCAESLINYGLVKKQSTMKKVMKTSGKLLITGIVFGSIAYCFHKQGLLTKPKSIFDKFWL